MHIVMNLLVVLQLLSALAIVGLVLIQHGKGADMGASFGGGSSGSLFGATGSANFLSRATAVAASVFFLTTLGLSFMASGRSGGGGGTTVLDRPSAAVSAPAAASAAQGSQIPTAAPAPVAPATPAAPASR